MPEGTATASLHPIWRGTLSFGLVSIPVHLLSGIRRTGVSLRMLDRDGTPLSRRYYCPREEREIHPEHIVRGYEVAPGEHFVVRDDELDALLPRKSRDIDLTRFTDLTEISPSFFDRPWFLIPAGESTKAYRLLTRMMEKTGKAGIATFVMRDREYLVAILSAGGFLRAETLRFHDELRTPEMVGLPEPEKPSKQKVDSIRRAIRKLTEKKLPARALTDREQERLRALVARKAGKGEDVVAAPDTPETESPDEEPREVPDLMAMLEASLAGDPGGSEEGPPIPDYDDLTVGEAKKRLSGLSSGQLSALLRYETQAKNRKTLRAAIEKRLSSV